MISRQKIPKRTRILSIPSKPYSFHSVHSAIGSRMNGMIFRSFRKRNSSQKNTNTVYSEYFYSRIVPKEPPKDIKNMIVSSVTSLYFFNFPSRDNPIENCLGLLSLNNLYISFKLLFQSTNCGKTLFQDLTAIGSVFH